MTSELARSIHSYISRRQPFLKAEVVGSATCISGQYVLWHSDGSEIERFDIELLVPSRFPAAEPHLRELSGRIPKNVDFHTYKDGSCCTGVWEVWTAANPGATISDYFEGPVRTYFISQILVYAGEKWPHGEYKHGLEGIFDAAAELLNTSDPDETLYTLHILAQSQPKGHWRCACLKQKPIRECCNDRIWALHEKFPPPSIAPLLKRVLKQLREDDPRRHPDFNVR
jgi:hypothetical protein